MNIAGVQPLLHHLSRHVARLGGILPRIQGLVPEPERERRENHVRPGKSREQIAELRRLNLPGIRGGIPVSGRCRMRNRRSREKNESR